MSDRPIHALERSDEEVLRRASESSHHGERFRRLWAGDSGDYARDGNDGESEADAALCELLAYYGGPDPERIERLWLRSGLYRKKLERADYRERTIALALQGKTRFDGDAPTGEHVKGRQRASNGNLGAVGGLGDLDAVLVRLDAVEPERVRWIWSARVPLGKLTLLDGDPGLGKSTLTLDIAARVSRGDVMPDSVRGDLAGPAGVVILSAEDGLADTIRLRPDAALWARPGRRRPGQRGRPRKRGHRLPTPKAMAATRRRWDSLPVTLYGRQVTPLVFGCTALWYGTLRDQPVCVAVVRDPSGRRRDEAFFCTDLTVNHAFILEGYARRWTIETCQTHYPCKRLVGEVFAA